MNCTVCECGEQQLVSNGYLFALTLVLFVVGCVLYYAPWKKCVCRASARYEPQVNEEEDEVQTTSV